jgi:hypothetical protein
MTNPPHSQEIASIAGSQLRKVVARVGISSTQRQQLDASSKSDHSTALMS